MWPLIFFTYILNISIVFDNFNNIFHNMNCQGTFVKGDFEKSPQSSKKILAVAMCFLIMLRNSEILARVFEKK